jgi:hypothetical protein
MTIGSVGSGQVGGASEVQGAGQPAAAPPAQPQQDAPPTPQIDAARAMMSRGFSTAALQARLSAAAAAHPSPVDGVQYTGAARVPDATPLPRGADGQVDRQQLLTNLTQRDTNPQTSTDASRCGATAVLAAVANAPGDPAQNLRNLCTRFAGDPSARPPVAPAVPLTPPISAQDRTMLTSVASQLRGGTATYGSLAQVGDFISRRYATPVPGGGGAREISSSAMYGVLNAAGVTAPDNGYGVFAPQAGQSWPMILSANDPNGPANHWVLAGVEPGGRQFVYDPDATSGPSQIHYAGDPAFQAYNDRFVAGRTGNHGAGFAPLNTMQDLAAMGAEQTQIQQQRRR